MLLHLFIALLASTSAHQWRHQFLGRVISARPTKSSDATDILVATDLNLIARLDAADGHIIWRYVPSTEKSLKYVVSVVIAETPVVVARFSSSDVIALGEEDGRIMWTRRGCAVHVDEKGIWVRECGEEVGQRGEWIEVAEEASVWSLEEGEGTFTWQLWSEGGKLQSFADGGLVAPKWRREEALAYGSNVAVRANTVLVVTELGVLFALESTGGEIRWRIFIGKGCALVGAGAELVIMACENEVLGVGVRSGAIIMRENVDGPVSQASMEEGAEGAVCVWLMNREGVESAVGEGCKRGADSEKGWLLYSKWGKTLTAVSWGQLKWHVNMPKGTRIVKVVVGKAIHAESARTRPAAVRVTADRGVLYRDDDGEYALVIAKGEEAEVGVLYAMLVDTKVGSLMDVVKHEYASGKVSAVRGDGWFIYTFWSEMMLAPEVHLVDLDERVIAVSRVQDAIYDAAVRMLGVGIVELLSLPHSERNGKCAKDFRNEGSNTQCKAEGDSVPEEIQKLPWVRRASMLTSYPIVGLDVTETELGLTEPWIAFILESGQVTLVPKLSLDARSGKPEDLRVLTDFLPRYRPVLNLDSSLGESKYIANGESIARIHGTVFAPLRQRESASRIVAFGIDLLYDELQPAGSFDALPPDFSYLSVVGMIVLLGAFVFYTQRLKSRAALSSSW